jgi:hypothetical protein
VKLEFESGIEGSLILKALLKDKKLKPERRAALLLIILTVAGWFVADLRTYGVGKFLDQYLAPIQRCGTPNKIARQIKHGPHKRAGEHDLYRYDDPIHVERRHELQFDSIVFTSEAECAAVNNGSIAPQQPAMAAPKMSALCRLLYRNENSATYSGRYLRLTL